MCPTVKMSMVAIRVATRPLDSSQDLVYHIQVGNAKLMPASQQHLLGVQPPIPVP